MLALLRGHVPQSSGKRSKFSFFPAMYVNWISVSHFSPPATGVSLERLRSRRRAVPMPHRSSPGAVGSATCFPNDATQPQGHRGREGQGVQAAPRFRSCTGAIAGRVGLVLTYPRGRITPSFSSSSRCSMRSGATCRPDVSARETLAPDDVPCSAARRVRGVRHGHGPKSTP